jgi:hypothetical protein
MTEISSDPPSKRDLVRELLDEGTLLLHLDPRRDGVNLPAHLRQDATVALSLGRHLAVPIPDLEVGDDAITATLSFNRTPHHCVLPWTAIYLVTTDHGKAYLWAQDAPPEALAELLALALAEREAPAEMTRPAPRPARPRPRLEAVDGGRTEPSPSPSAGSPTDPSSRPTLRLVR